MFTLTRGYAEPMLYMCQLKVNVINEGQISSNQIFIGYNTAMVCQGPVLAHLRQYWPEGFSPRANASEGVPIRARGIP